MISKMMQMADGRRHLVVIGACSGLAMLNMALAVMLMAAQMLWLGRKAEWLAGPAALCTVMALGLELFVAIYGRREVHARDALVEEARQAKTQTDQLFAMTDMLQSADDHDDATAVLMAASLRLLPEFGAALYIFNNSRDRLDLAGSWNMPEGFHTAETLAPANCWALKRGKMHFNVPADGTLCCGHHGSSAASLEVPMLARGAVYGLLLFVSPHEDARSRFVDINRLCRALADSMSLALSNIALREKLRTQSLRDPLTGLYNRRYMEDTLERYISLSERTGVATALLMIDLDNFKRLNDQHGHAKGDAVLRDVASQLIGGLRPSDIVCRYGGEELIVILPNCGLADAVLKAEGLRVRIASLSDVHDVEVSASFGVAAIPETSVSQADIVAMADAALYRAKHSGKNCVMAAEARTVREEPQVRLTTAVKARAAR